MDIRIKDLDAGVMQTMLQDLDTKGMKYFYSITRDNQFCMDLSLWGGVVNEVIQKKDDLLIKFEDPDNRLNVSVATLKRGSFSCIELSMSEWRI